AANIARRRLDERLTAALAAVREVSSRGQHLTRLGEALLACGTRDAVVGVLATHLLHVLPVDYAAIARFDAATGVLRGVVVHPERRFADLALADGQLVAEAMEQREVLYVPDIGPTHYAERAVLSQSGLASVLAAPVLVDGEPRGMFVV